MMPPPDNQSPFYQIPLPLVFEEDLPKILLWQCPNCGQQIFTMPQESPPDMCDYCDDYTTWKHFTPQDT